MTKIMVLAASKHGSTAQIAEAIGAELGSHGLEVVVADAHHPPLLMDADGYVLGSAVYAGHWVTELRHFVEQHHHLLASKPVWLFSSGPVSNEATGMTEPPEVPEFALALGARDHRVFEGRLDPADLNLMERAAVRFVHAKYGDYRDWSDIASWAAGIALSMSVRSE